MRWPAAPARWPRQTIRTTPGCGAHGATKTRAFPWYHAEALMATFSASEFLPVSIRDALCRLRISDPDRSLRAAKARSRRSRLTLDGKLNILAADHPARRVTKVGDDPLGMADRHGFLARILRVLMGETVDGAMATMDVLEDLLVIDSLVREAGGPAMLDGKLLIASLNRGGLARTKWEMDD